MKFSKLAEYLTLLESTSSRLKITEVLADLLGKAGEDEVAPICYLSLGQLAPAYKGVEFNLAEKLMVRAVARATGVGESLVREKYKKSGDLGDTVEKFKVQSSKFKIVKNRKELEVREVYGRLSEIAGEAGEGSVERKIEKMALLLGELDPASAKFVARIPLGKLRLGFSELTILDALSWMISGDKSLKGAIEAAFEVKADIGEISKNIKDQIANSKDKKKDYAVGQIVKDLGRIKPILGVPISPSLCQRLPTPEEIIGKMGRVAVEPKYDGTRLQVHWGRGVKAAVFTRSLENVTHMFPDIVAAMEREVKAKEVILDGEGIGFDFKTDRFLPFQDTIKRKRKHEIEETLKAIPLKLFVFDVIYKDGQSLLEVPLRERRRILERILGAGNKKILISPQMVTESAAELRDYHHEQIARGLEGVVVKKLEAGYDPGRRGFTWVKFKTEQGKKGAGLADSLDCVVMGYNQGRGKRADFGVGGFLVGVRAGGFLVTISKIGTGLTDEQWRELKRRCDKVKVADKPKEYKVDKNMAPDVWCLPAIVTEIEADNVTRSPIHTAGLALRFPRLVRFRDDKSVDQASSLAEAEKLYKMQK